MTGWVLEKCEDAWRNYFHATSLSASCEILRGLDTVEKIGDSVIICYADSMNQIEYGMGIYNVSVQLIFRHVNNEVDTTGSLEARHAIMQTMTEKIFNNSALISDLKNATSELAIYDLEVMGSNNGFNESAWESNTNINMVCGIHKT